MTNYSTHFYNRNVLNNTRTKTKTPLRWIVFGAVVVCLLLPARFFQTYSLSFFRVDSNISVNYLNFVDLLLFSTSLFCLAFSNRVSFSKSITLIFLYPLLAIFYFFGLVFSGNFTFCGELISKSIVVLSSLIIGNYLYKNFNSKELFYLFLVPLFVLVFSSFFLRQYGSYESSRRVGTLGFGSNETASFACMLIFAMLITKSFGFIPKIIVIVVSFYCLLITSSRRGLVLALAILFIFFVSKFALVIKKGSIKSNLLILIQFSLIVAFVVFIFQRDKILDFLNGTPIFVRLRFNEQSGIKVFDVDDRIEIYKTAFAKLLSSPFFGTYGCDLLLAQESFSHCHNIFLQILVTYGLFGGLPISAFLIIVFIKSLRCTFDKRGTRETISFPLAIFILYFIGDQLGYLLWNPKGLFLIMLCSVFILLKHNEIAKNNVALSS